MDDYTGKKFNYLTVLSQFRKEGIMYYHCRCDCGNEKDIIAAAVRKGRTKTCGSIECRKPIIALTKSKKINLLIGKKFNSYTVLSEVRRNKKPFLICRCDCGRIKEIRKERIVNGITKNCGTGKCWNNVREGYHLNKGGNSTGKKFNSLTVLSQYLKDGTMYFYCRCDCGKEKEFRAYKVRTGVTKTCGDYYCRKILRSNRFNTIDYTGKKFNSLTVLYQYLKDGKLYFYCRCDCGKEKEFHATRVKCGLIMTCGKQNCRNIVRGYRYSNMDFSGQKFNSLTVLSQFKEGQNWRFRCLCDCGKEVIKDAEYVRTGYTKTCGDSNCWLKYRTYRYNFHKMDYTGQKYMALTVLSQFKKGTRWYFRCRCDCGLEKDILALNVLNGDSKSCGKIECREKFYTNKNKNIFNLTGGKFGKLTVIKWVRTIYRKTSGGNSIARPYWLCQCTCGKTNIISSNHLLIGHVSSCGCMNFFKSAAEDSLVLAVLENMGYRENGRKIGVTVVKRRKNKKRIYSWAATLMFQGISQSYYFGTYQKALKKRLELQEQISMPYILRNINLLPQDIDIDYWRNLNRNIKFNPKKYLEEKINEEN